MSLLLFLVIVVFVAGAAFLAGLIWGQWSTLNDLKKQGTFREGGWVFTAVKIKKWKRVEEEDKMGP